MIIWPKMAKIDQNWNFETKVLGLNMLKIHYNFRNISFIPQIFAYDVGSQLWKNFLKKGSPFAYGVLRNEIISLNFNLATTVRLRPKIERAPLLDMVPPFFNLYFCLPKAAKLSNLKYKDWVEIFSKGEVDHRLYTIPFLRK